MDVGWVYGKKLQIPVWLVWEKQFTPTTWGVQIAVAALDFYRHSWKTVKKIISLTINVRGEKPQDAGRELQYPRAQKQSTNFTYGL